MEIIYFNQEHFIDLMKIYEEGIATGQATFETTAPSWDQWDKSHLSYARIAILDDSKILGWGALSPVSSRCVYGGVAEVSVYISSLARGKGIGTQILKQLIKESEEEGIWTLQSSIFKENIGSKKLHQKCGFRVIGYKERVAQLNGVWKDNVLLERRSKVVGIN